MFLSLVSSSSGNCTLVSDGKTTLLADCGLSCKRLEQTLDSIGKSAREVDALLVTHEHSDHIKGIGAVSRKYDLPVFATAKTHEVMNIGNIGDGNVRYVSPDIDFEIGTIGVKPFSIPHDAAAPVGYNFFFGEKKLSVATDIGKMNDYVFNNLRGSIAVLLESNHDIDMLKRGGYPRHLKQRILSDFGHLSNSAAACTVLELVKAGTRHIMLGHLSAENNTPRAAFAETARLLLQNGVELQKDAALTVASGSEVSYFR